MHAAKIVALQDEDNFGDDPLDEELFAMAAEDANRAGQEGVSFNALNI